MNRSCVDDETLMDYIEGRLNRRLRGRVEKHLSNCADCRDLLMLAGDLIHEKEDLPANTVPSAVTQRAIESVETISKNPHGGRRHFLNSGQRLLAAGRSLLNEITSGSTPHYADLRSGARTFGDDFIRDRISCSSFDAVIEIEKKTDALFTLQVKITPEEPLDAPLRVSLFFDNREIASASLLDESVQFEDFPNGRYALLFFQDTQEIYVYDFEI